MMANISCAMPWTHHFTGNEIVLWEKCTSQEYEDFFYRELEIVKWIIYNKKSPCDGNFLSQKIASTLCIITVNQGLKMMSNSHGKAGKLTPEATLMKKWPLGTFS